MKKTILKTRFIALAALVVAQFIAASSWARTAFEYDWVGGQAGYSGTLLLDASSGSPSAGPLDNLNDIVSLTITTPGFGTVVFDSSTADLAVIKWNPTRVQTMVVHWFNGPLESFAVEGPSFLGTQGSSGPGDFDFSGHWRALGAPVPDASSTVWMFGLTLAVVGCFHALQRRVSTAPFGTIR